MVPHAKSEQPFKFATQRLNVAFASLRVSVQALEDMQGGAALDRTDFSRDIWTKADRLHLLLIALVVANLVHGEAALHDELLEWNAALRVPPEVLPRSSYRLAIFLSQCVIVLRTNRHLKQLNDSVQLARPELFEQVVSVLSNFNIGGHRVLVYNPTPPPPFPSPPPLPRTPW